MQRGEGEEEGGRYLTPTDLPTYADALAMLTLHIRSQEICSAPDKRPQATRTRAPKAKVPKLDMNRTAQEWKSNWLRSKLYTRIEEHNNFVYNLCACFSHDLDIAAADDSLDYENLTKEEILIKVKRLAVKSTNTLVSQVQFFQMAQDRGELAINYLTRL